MELRDILAEQKKKNRLTTGRLSELSGVPKGTINKLLTGETANPTMTTLRALANALGCPLSLLCGADALREAVPVHLRRVPLLGEIAAGQPILTEQSSESIWCDDSLRCDFALRVCGDSMTGARILDGDLVLIRAQDDVEDGDIAAVILDDHATLKHLYHIKNGVQLVSDNPKYPPMIFTSEDFNSIRVLGKAVAFQSGL